MQANVGRETNPEKVLRAALRQHGLSFEQSCRPEPRLRITADVVFPKQRVCVFVDGCFWHGCPNHFATPRTNEGWWREKIMDNRARDVRQTRALRDLGWNVLRYWEHEIVAERLPTLCREIEAAVAGSAVPH